MTLRELEKDAAVVGRRWLRELLFEEWGMKLLALAITFGLWWAVTGQRAPASLPLRHVPLAIIPPSDMEISNDLREEVDVTLRGNQHALATLKADEVGISFDASGLQPGMHVVRLAPQNVRLQLPEGLNPESVD